MFRFSGAVEVIVDRPMILEFCQLIVASNHCFGQLQMRCSRSFKIGILEEEPLFSLSENLGTNSPSQHSLHTFCALACARDIHMHPSGRRAACPGSRAEGIGRSNSRRRHCSERRGTKRDIRFCGGGLDLKLAPQHENSNATAFNCSLLSSCLE